MLEAGNAILHGQLAEYDPLLRYSCFPGSTESAGQRALLDEGEDNGGAVGAGRWVDDDQWLARQHQETRHVVRVVLKTHNPVSASSSQLQPHTSSYPSAVTRAERDPRWS